MNTFFKIKKTHSCGELDKNSIGKNIKLNGWVKDIRDFGQFRFVTIKDIKGITQLVFDPENSETYAIAKELKTEYIIGIEGIVVSRGDKNINKKMKTGEIEIKVKELEIINRSEIPPFVIDEHISVSEAIRLQYRYLDLRRDSMQKNILLRHNITKIIRDDLNSFNFIEIETPILTKSTPEGARDFLVPSRSKEGGFYALPQSPQLFKQLLMVSGFDKYYQIARCFRDEDLRNDRQPEFTQVDIEASFIDQEDIYKIIEKIIFDIMKEIKGIEIELPLPRLTWQESMNRYGIDRPDTRFEIELKEVTDIFENSEFVVFKPEDGKIIKAISIPEGGNKFSRKKIDKLTDLAKKYGAKGLAWIKYKNEKFSGPIAKFLKPEEEIELKSRLEIENDHLILFVSDSFTITNAALAAIRISIAKELDLIDDQKFNFLWVTEFPMFEWSKEDERYTAMHHPFTSPLPEDLKYIKDGKPEKMLSLSYDIVLNGLELGGGSIRIHDQNLQRDIFSLLKISNEEAEEKFGFLLNGLKYGAPPHGGIALGLDRLVMLLSETATSIRDVIPFPKTLKGGCLMTDAPSKVSNDQLSELNLAILEQSSGEE